MKLTTKIEKIDESSPGVKGKIGILRSMESKVFSRILDKVYETGQKYSTDFKENMTIKFDSFLGKWNYVVVPDLGIETQ